jgi:hypothetical protein
MVGFSEVWLCIHGISMVDVLVRAAACFLEAAQLGRLFNRINMWLCASEYNGLLLKGKAEVQDHSLLGSIFLGFACVMVHLLILSMKMLVILQTLAITNSSSNLA